MGANPSMVSLREQRAQDALFGRVQERLRRHNERLSKKRTRPRNRAAQDATLINLRTAKARIAALEREVKALKQFNKSRVPPAWVTAIAHDIRRIGKDTDRNTRALRTIYESANWTQMRRQKGRKR